MDIMEGSALTMAAQTGYVDMARYLLSIGGFDLEARNRDYCTPLILAARYRQVDMVQFLLENGANPNAMDSYGSSVATNAVL